MTLNEYQNESQKFDLTKETANHKPHSIFQFLEEAGELAGIFKRELRGDEKYKDPGFFYAQLEKELGDCLWGLAAIGASHGLSLDYIAKRNIEKLEDRYNRGVIKGEGDSR